jgi:NitT/TauT family transport system permease protein
MNSPKNIGWSIVIFIVATGLWEAAARGLKIPAYILPPPSQIALAMYRGLAAGLYEKHLLVTMGGTVLGFVTGCALAFSLGTAVALSKRADYFLYPYIVMFQAMPKVALAPLIIVWFGLGITSKVVSAALVAFFPLMVNTIVGLRSADEDRVNLLRSLAATESQIFWKLRVPSALPFIMAGLEVAMILALIGTIVAEFVGAEAGLGMLIQTMNFSMDVAGQFSVLLVLSAVGLLLNKVVAFARRRVLFWDFSEKSMAGAGEDKPAIRLNLVKGEAA